MKHKLLKVLLLPLNYHCLLQRSLTAFTLSHCSSLSYLGESEITASPRQVARNAVKIYVIDNENQVGFFFSHPVFVEMRN